MPRRGHVDLGVVVRPRLPVVMRRRGAGAPRRPAREPTRSRTKTRLPSDLLIFTPSRLTMATCVQCRTYGRDPGRLGLGDLRFVVRVDEVVAATVNVDGVAERAGRHHRALDVPARAARAPGARPARLARGRCLPEHEVERVPLARVVRIGAALSAQLDHGRVVEAAQPAVVRVDARVEEDPSVDRVGVAAVDEPRDPVRPSPRHARSRAVPRRPGGGRSPPCRGRTCAPARSRARGSRRRARARRAGCRRRRR